MSQSLPQLSSHLLKELQEVPLPEAVPWWPQTLGWQVLMLAALLWGVVWLSRWGRRWWRARYRREGLATLQRLKGCALAQQITELQQLMSLMVRYAYPEATPPARHGLGWLSFLDETGQSEFSKGPGLAWQRALFQPRQAWQIDAEQMLAVLAQAELWIRCHPGCRHG
ncbi:DUF4381 domain-containing protein [Ferrimonas marina]|uniref:DUF4381 domain-containing protein n=1 Tax=Ferrimonas marina TaxID=299255 RepID=A0A1M5VE33_9GAMM|nr:DUF4381 domain-containing protein [Ferrimonas marina]SHH73509.1 protein of unknown function [Ferrimonas marina]